MTPRKAILTLFWSVLLAGGAQTSLAQTLTTADLWTDTKLYFTAPVRWDTQDWLFFGGALGAIAAAHQYDGNTRHHFAGPHPVLSSKDPNTLTDAAPAAAITFVTWAFAQLTNSNAGRVEAYTMLEAAGLSAITAEGLKFAAGRVRPNQTSRVDDWRAGGSSFPSLHATAAFAIGTVLAESGNDEYRWIRRVLGYGMGAGTAYLRVKGNQHWLSDTVAGAAVGIATGQFAVNRRRTEQKRKWEMSVAPAQGGGVMLSLNYEPQ